MFDSIEERVRRVELYLEAQRIIGLYADYMSEGRFAEIPGLFALDTPTLRAEMLWGVYQGTEGIHRLYGGLFPALRKQETQGTEQLQAMEVPIIKVAKDQKTVKAVWVCPGYITAPDAAGVLQSYWSWQKCACDFIATDQGLKIWHLHIYGLFECLYGTSQVLPSGTIRFSGAIPEEFSPDAPSTTTFPLSRDSIYPYAPAVPPAYTVFDQDYAY